MSPALGENSGVAATPGSDWSTLNASPCVPATWRSSPRASFTCVTSRPAFALAYLGLTFVFLARGVAGYVPALWRRARATSFYRLNRLYYSPLCLLIAAGLVVNFILG